MCKKFQGIVHSVQLSSTYLRDSSEAGSGTPPVGAARACSNFEACNRHQGAEKRAANLFTNTISKLLAGHLQGALTHVACSISRCCMRRRLQRLLREQLKSRWWKYGMSTWLRGLKVVARIENTGAWKEILQQNQIVQNIVQGNDFGSTTSSDSIFTTAAGWSACETLCSMPTPARRPLSKSAQSPLKPTNHQTYPLALPVINFSRKKALSKTSLEIIGMMPWEVRNPW